MQICHTDYGTIQLLQSNLINRLSDVLQKITSSSYGISYLIPRCDLIIFINQLLVRLCFPSIV